MEKPFVEQSDIKKYLNSIVNGTLEVGFETDIPPLDRYLSVKRKDLAAIIGVDNIGKSSVVWQIMINMNVLHGWKWCMFCSENGEGQIVRTFIQYRTGRNYLDLNEMERSKAEDWFFENFTLIKASAADKWSDLKELILKANKIRKHDGCFVDPYNSLGLPKGESRHEYDYEVLGDMRKLKEAEDMAVWVSMHVGTGAGRNVLKKEDGWAEALVGHVAPPSKYDVEGGNKTANRVDLFLILHRFVSANDFWKRKTLIWVAKVKDKETGGDITPKASPVMLEMKPDMCGFWYDEHQNMTSEQGFSKMIDPLANHNLFGKIRTGTQDEINWEQKAQDWNSGKVFKDNPIVFDEPDPTEDLPF